MRRRMWWVAGVCAVLSVAAQAGLGVVVWQRVRPRLPVVAGAVAGLDQLIAGVVAAAGDSAAVTVSGIVATSACQHTMFAAGHRFTRTADLYTAAGGEDALIGRIAAALPETDAPHREPRSGAGAAPLTASLGASVVVEVTQIDQGWVAATATTDCRAGRGPGAPDDSPPAAARGAIGDMFAALGTTAASWREDAVPCASGRIVTVDAISQATGTDRLATRLAASVPPGARVFTSTSNRLVWRQQNTSVIVAASDDGAHVTAQYTTGC